MESTASHCNAEPLARVAPILLPMLCRAACTTLKPGAHLLFCCAQHAITHVPSRCTAKGCNRSACEACATANKMGLRFNATVDGAFMSALATAGANATSGLEAVVYHGWTTSRHYVSSVRPAPSDALMFSNPSDRPIGFWTGRSSEGGQRYYVENAEMLLDGAGEFFVRQTGEILYVDHTPPPFCKQCRVCEQRVQPCLPCHVDHTITVLQTVPCV
jgi:hypothetical protein